MKKWIRLTAWIFVCAVLVGCLNRIFVPKWTDDLATTYTINGFYEEEKNSLDVVFFGSSQVLCGISPMEIYDQTGIKSYVLGTGSQSIICTYQWIKEMDKYQNPNVIVLDTWMAIDESILDDGANRNAMDYMRFSLGKIQTAVELERAYKEKYGFESTPISYALPILEFHSRWKELDAYDVTYWFSDKHFARKGYCPSGIIYTGDKKEYNGTVMNLEKEKWAMADYQVEYLQKIIEYCKEKNIELLLIKTPMANYNAGLYNSIAAIAESNHVPFVDMNMESTWAEVGMDYTTDFQSPPHLNINGANKVSDYLADYLLENYPSLAESVKNAGDSAIWGQELEEYRSYEEQYLLEFKNQIDATSQSASSP